MQTKCSRKKSSFAICIVLIVAMALFTTGCNGDTENNASSASVEEPGSGESRSTDARILGEGDTVFDFTVTDREGSETRFEIHTDKENVGEALEELGLIDGEKSEYGLFVKAVNGITADYDKDGVYWAFYVNGEYSQAGVDATAIKEGDSYSFRIE